MEIVKYCQSSFGCELRMGGRAADTARRASRVTSRSGDTLFQLFCKSNCIKIATVLKAQKCIVLFSGVAKAAA